MHKADASQEPMVVAQQETVLDLKKAVQCFVQLRQEWQGSAMRISWRHMLHIGLAKPKKCESPKFQPPQNGKISGV